MWTCPNTSKRLLRRIAPPHSLRRLDPRPIWSQFSLKITHSFSLKKKKEKKKGSRPEWVQDKSSHFILLYFHTVFHYNYKNPITYDSLVGTSRLFPVASYSVPQPQQIGGKQKEVFRFASALLACNKSLREPRFLSFSFLLIKRVLDLSSFSRSALKHKWGKKKPV